MSKMSIAPLFVMLLGSVFLYGNNIFKSADSFHHALDSARSNRKLLLSYAARPSAPCCIAMEKVTFNNQKVQNMLKNSFYPIKVDLSTSIGKTWAQNFQIVNTPTLLFFDDQGTLIKQVESCISSIELMVILEEVLFFKNNGFWPMEPTHPTVLTVIVPKDSASSSPKLNDQIGSIRVLLDQVVTNDPFIRSVVEKVRLEFPKHHLSVKLVKSSEQAFYQIWIGNFKECRKAQILLEELKNQGFEKAQLNCDPE